MISKSSLGLQAQKIFVTYFNSTIIESCITMSTLVCLVILIAPGFLQITFSIPLLLSHVDKSMIIQEPSDVAELKVFHEPSAVEKFKISGKPSDVEKLEISGKPCDVDRPKNEAGTNMGKRVQRSYGQQ